MGTDTVTPLTGEEAGGADHDGGEDQIIGRPSKATPVTAQPAQSAQAVTGRAADKPGRNSTFAERAAERAASEGRIAKGGVRKLVEGADNDVNTKPARQPKRRGG